MYIHNIEVLIFEMGLYWFRRAVQLNAACRGCGLAPLKNPHGITCRQLWLRCSSL